MYTAKRFSLAISSKACISAANYVLSNAASMRVCNRVHTQRKCFFLTKACMYACTQPHAYQAKSETHILLKQNTHMQSHIHTFLHRGPIRSNLNSDPKFSKLWIVNLVSPLTHASPAPTLGRATGSRSGALVKAPAPPSGEMISPPAVHCSHEHLYEHASLGV